MSYENILLNNGGYIMYRLNKLLEQDVIDMVTTESVIDDIEIDDMIETVEAQPNPTEKESLFKEKEKEEVEESGFLYDNFGKEDPTVDYSPIF
jgi:hypothetical protein